MIYGFCAMPCVRLAFVLLLLVGGLQAAGPHERAPEDQKAAEFEAREAICGPQCVKYVLARYGRTVALSELVQELQGPETQNGTSFDRMAKALEKRGVFIRAVSIPRDSAVRWNYPVILHFSLNNRGHFVVWEPQGDNDSCILWSSGTGATSVPRNARLEHLTEIALLTAPEEISDAQLGGLTTEQKGALLAAVVLPVMLALALFSLSRLLRAYPNNGACSSSSKGQAPLFG